MITKTLQLHDRICHWLFINTSLSSGYLFDASDRWVHRNVRKKTGKAVEVQS